MKRSAKREIPIRTKFGTFLCVFESNAPEPGFTVTVPGAPGFVTAGRTLEEAKKTARAGLEFHCECLFLEGRKRLSRVKERAHALAA